MITYKNNFILDPTWMKSGIIDHEYQYYVLMAAKEKFKERLESNDLDPLYELFFHYLNLNGLIVNGYLYDSRLNKIENDTNLDKVNFQLSQKVGDAINIAREANELFVELILLFLDAKMETLKEMNLFFNNFEIHKKDPIFIVTNSDSNFKYQIFKVSIDKRKKFGYSFSFIKEYEIKKIEDRIVEKIIHKDGLKQLRGFSSDVNVIFGYSKEKVDNREMASIIKDSILINKMFTTKEDFFDPTVLKAFHSLLKSSKVVPVTLENFYN